MSKSETEWKDDELISATDSSYMKCKAKQCEVCGRKADLTVHHIFPRDAISFFEIKELKVKYLATLCSECHNAYEVEASFVRVKLKRANHKCRAYDKAVGILTKLKNKQSRKKLSKTELESHLEYLNIYTGTYVTLSNLPNDLKKWYSHYYKGYTMKQIRTIFSKHYALWAYQENLMYTREGNE
jgi:hypothetical protein